MSVIFCDNIISWNCISTHSPCQHKVLELLRAILHLKRDDLHGVTTNFPHCASTIQTSEAYPCSSVHDSPHPISLVFCCRSQSTPEYCVGSTLNLTVDDIVPCMVVGVNASGSVAIQDGLLVIQAGDREERFNVSDLQVQQGPDTPSGSAKSTTSFNMEPGK